MTEDILSFWFGELSGPHDVGPNQKKWWMKDDAFDAEIRARFGEHVEAAIGGAYDDWVEAPRSALALIILLDQFTRNIFRGSPRTWENDTKALAVTLQATEAGHDVKLRTVERQFMYMPLVHSEVLAHHERAAELVDAALNALPEDAKRAFETWRDSATQHKKIVQRFGRYPHRNAILGRESTDEERAFLEKPGSSF